MRQRQGGNTEVTLVIDAPKSGGARPVAASPAPPRLNELQDRGEIGTGGTGTVRRMYDPTLRREIAMKTLAPGRDRVAEIARLEDEARLTAQLEHSNIVPVHELNLERSGHPYFTMRLVDGRTFSKMIDDSRGESDKFGRLHDLLQVFVKVCDAAAFAHHRRIVHCDIKPENIMVGDYGEVYLVDWGVAEVVETSHPEPPSISTGARKRSGVRGTPEYMAPEQADRRASIDARTDVFGLGAVLYRILTGRSPYEGTKKETLDKARRCEFISPLDIPGLSLPQRIIDIVLKAMAKRPEDRYPSAQELRKDVHDFLRGGWHLPSKVFRAGETIVEEGAWGDAAYIIVGGVCEVTKKIAGTPEVLRRLGPGEVFGETAILSGNVRTATVRAVEETTVKVVTRELLQEELGVDTWLGKFVLALADRFREMDQRFGAGAAPARNGQ